MDKSENVHSFWKNSIRIVPGRPSSEQNLKINASKPFGVKNNTFEDYQMSVRDAWDTGDDEFCIFTSRNEKSVCARNRISSHKETRLTFLEKDENIECPDANQSDESTCSNFKSRCRGQRFYIYPGWPQLQKYNPNFTECEDNQTKINKFSALIDAPCLEFDALKELCWSGIPKQMRAVSWRLLSKYLPPNADRREGILQSKRRNYLELRSKYYFLSNKDESQQDTYRQIHIDVPRMNPHIELFKQEVVQKMFERILFIWSIRHPASGYVQGINDLVTPFFIVYLEEAVGVGTELDNIKFDALSEDVRHAIEADSFWCLSTFLDCIQDNYIFAQLGIQEKVNQLKELIQRIDVTLHQHLQNHGIDYLQFSFRWMNNLLTRELPLQCTIRLWDTYLAESDGFAQLHLYVCAAFLLHWRILLLNQNDFQGLMILLQNLPTCNWSEKHVSILVAEAYRLKFTYADALKHLERS